MIEKKHKENERDDQTARKGQLRKLPQEELKKILENHRRWIKSEKKEGEQANLAYTDLRRTNFARILPGEIILAEAIFRGARLNKAKLNKANLEGADFSDANLNKAQLKKAILTQARLVNADLSESILNKAKFDKAILQGARLNNAQLNKANLEGADFSDANLNMAHLIKAILTRARLVNTDLSESILKKAKFDEAVLHGADLRGAIGLKENQINTAQMDWRTMLPENLRQFVIRIPNEELRNILVEHKRWLQSNGEYGKQADLTKARMRGVNFQELEVSEVSLERAKLARADLRGAVLDGVNMRAADLLETNLRGASLIDADLTDAKRFSVAQLGDCNVCGAKLSESIREFEGLKNVENACKNARRIFGLMVFLCVYCLITVVPIPDLEFIRASGFSKLPVLGTSVPLVSFFWLGPAIIVIVLFYFELYMQRLWEGLADLPSFFPDGIPLSKRTYPWLGISETRRTSADFGREVFEGPSVEVLTIAIFRGVAVPATIFAVNFIYLKSHDWSITSLLILLCVFSFAAFLFSTRIYFFTINNGYWNSQNILKCRSLRNKFRGGKHFWRLVALFVILVIMALYTSYQSIEGPVSGLVFRDKACSQNLRVVRFCLNVEGSDISPKPDNWSDTTSEISAVNGANLQGKNIRWAKAKGTFLVNANLSSIKARGVDFQEADLRGADLRDAELRCVNFEGASLSGADLRSADLTDAIGLDCAQLHSAIIDSTTILPDYIVNPPTGPPCIMQ